MPHNMANFGELAAENRAPPPLGRGAGCPSNNVASAEAYLHAKFHLDPSNRLATIHQRYRQDRQTDRQWSDSM